MPSNNLAKALVKARSRHHNALTITRIYGMVYQHRLSSGGLPNAPNNEPSNLWIRRTPNRPHVAPINQVSIPPNYHVQEPE
ncbi:hypothetical protein PGT21_032554 [Puccinia graminis f. sp. tritici]|nr:hypothetical protein PGT21_032554 [Puccinia graminis f. sp. tritici]